MKAASVLLALPLAAQGRAVEKRQAAGLNIEGLLSGALSIFMKDMKPFKVEDVPSTMKRPGAKNVRIWHGPLKLLPAAEAAKAKGVKSDPNSNAFFATLSGLPQDSFILKTNSTLMYEDGSFANVNNGVYNHHVQIIDIGKSNPPLFQCGPVTANTGKGMGMPGSYIGGSSTDGAPSLFSTPDGMFNSGYYLNKKSKIMLSSELVNYAKETKNVFIVTEVDYVTGKEPGMMDTSVGILSVNQCDKNPSPFIFAPAGKKQFDLKSKAITMLQDGYLLSRRGHMHDGGTGMIMKINDKLVCDSKAQYGNGMTMQGHGGESIDALMGMVECTDPVAVKKGDTLWIEAYFDLDKHPPRAHAHGGGEAEEMALLGYVFAANKTTTA